MKKLFYCLEAAFLNTSRQSPVRKKLIVTET